MDAITEGPTSLRSGPRPTAGIGVVGRQATEASTAPYVAPGAGRRAKGLRAALGVEGPRITSPRRRTPRLGVAAGPMGKISNPAAAAVAGQPSIAGVKVACAKAPRAPPAHKAGPGVALKRRVGPPIAGANGETARAPRDRRVAALNAPGETRPKPLTRPPIILPVPYAVAA